MINHMYWCVVSTPNGDGDMMVSKWLSLENHIHNNLDMVNSLEVVLMEGLLDELETRYGLSGVTSYVYVQNSTIINITDSIASEKLSALLTNAKLSKDIARLSSVYQTFLE